MKEQRVSYQELLKDARWIKRRNEILTRDDNTCQMCGSNNSYLCVHHKYYKNHLKPWEYPDDALITVCHSCHDKIHKCRIVTPKVTRYKRINIPIYHGDKNYFWMKGSSRKRIFFHINNERVELDTLQAKLLIRRLTEIIETFGE